MASVHFPAKTSTLSGGSDPFSRLAVIPYVSQTSLPGTTSTTSPGSFHIISSLCTTFPFSPPVIATSIHQTLSDHPGSLALEKVCLSDLLDGVLSKSHFQV